MENKIRKFEKIFRNKEEFVDFLITRITQLEMCNYKYMHGESKLNGELTFKLIQDNQAMCTSYRELLKFMVINKL